MAASAIKVICAVHTLYVSERSMEPYDATPATINPPLRNVQNLCSTLDFTLMVVSTIEQTPGKLGISAAKGIPIRYKSEIGAVENTRRRKFSLLSSRKVSNEETKFSRLAATHCLLEEYCARKVRL